jgi:predicted TIM-barrel fold metal-dependent hydrolase
MIDCDVHIEIPVEDFLPFVEPAQRAWFRRTALNIPGDLWTHPTNWFRDELDDTLGEVACTPEIVAREALDATGADIGVLNGDLGIYVSLMTSTYRAEAFARAHNDWLREVWFPADARYRGSIIVPAQDPRAAAREIERCAEDPRFLQVVLIGGSERPYGDPRYLPMLEAAHACGLPLAIHSGGEGLGVAAPPGGAGMPTFYVEWHTLGSACSIMAHLVSLVVHGTFERLPGFRVVLMEGGLGWLPGILWRLDTNWRGLRSEVPWLERRPSEIVREHVRFTTQPLEHTDGKDELLWQMLEAVGAPDILLYASDYPHWDFDDPRTMLSRLPSAWREAVMHGNAAELYGERLALPA